MLYFMHTFTLKKNKMEKWYSLIFSPENQLEHEKKSKNNIFSFQSFLLIFGGLGTIWGNTDNHQIFMICSTPWIIATEKNLIE